LDGKILELETVKNEKVTLEQNCRSLALDITSIRLKCTELEKCAQSFELEKLDLSTKI